MAGGQNVDVAWELEVVPSLSLVLDQSFCCGIGSCLVNCGEAESAEELVCKGGNELVVPQGASDDWSAGLAQDLEALSNWF